MPRRLIVLSAATALALLGLAGCGWFQRPAPGPDVLAMVNGQPIQTAELNQLYAEQTAGAAAPLPPQQSLQLRLSLLNQLIDRHILLQYAAQLGIQADPQQLDRALSVARARQPAPPEPELRQQAADAVILNQLLQQEVADKIHITDDDIAQFYQQNQASFHLPERQYHVLEIVVTPRPGAVTNLAEDKATTPAAARKKMAMLQQRLAAKADFATLAQQYSEDPATASSGGDLGLIPQSVLMTQTPAPLRDAILRLQPGQVSPVITTPEGYYLLKLEGIEPAGVRPLTDPQVKQSIRDLLTNARQQVLQAAFLTTVRDRAKVENFYAERLLNGQS
ncbi:MAG TPA: peptidyl-prolyl cis-trans isomerase [Terriglobales bacterium]